MIIKLTATGKNETIFVNFDYVRTFRRDGAFTELVMSDDKYYKLAVTETPDEIYTALYPNILAVACTDSCKCSHKDEGLPASTAAPKASTAKKPTTTKKTN